MQAPGVAAPAGNPQQIQQAGAALQQVGSATMRIAGMMEAEQTSAEAKQAYTALADYATEQTEGPDGYFQRVGQDAVGYQRAAALRAIEERARDLEKGLHSDVARQMFRDNADRYIVGAKRRIYQHEAQERRTWHLGMTDAMAAQSAREAVSSLLRGDGDPNIAIGAKIVADRDNVRVGGEAAPEEGAPFEQTAGEIKDLWRMHLRTAIEQTEEGSKLRGESPQVRQERVLRLTSDIYGAAVSGLLDQGRTQEARDFLEKVPGNRMDPVTRGKLQRTVRTAVRADNAFERSNAFLDDFFQDRAPVNDLESPASALPPDATPEQIATSDVRSWEAEMRQSIDPVGPVGDPLTDRPADRPPPSLLRRAAQEFRRQVDAGEIDAQTYDMMMARVREEAAIREQEWQGQTQDLLLDAERFLEENGGNVDSPTFPQSLRSDLVDRGVLDKVRVIASNRMQRVTDPEVYGAMLLDFDSGAMRGKNQSWLFNRYRAHLSEGDWRQAQSFLAAANPAIKPPPDDDLFPLNDQIMEQAQAGGVISGRSEVTGRAIPASADEAKLLSEFRAELQQRVNAERADGRTPNTSEIVQIAKEIAFEKAYVPENEWLTFTDPEVHLWQSGLTEQQRREASIDLNDGVLSDTYKLMADIPAGAQWDILTAYRTSLLPPDAQTLARRRIREIMAASNGLQAREAIEQMWQQVGIGRRKPTPEEMMKSWLRMEGTPGSRWYQWSSR